VSGVAVASLAGSPGVSTLVSAMAVASTSPLLVVECPPDGGVLAVRWGLPREVTVTDLAADADPGRELWERARPWAGASRLLAADASAVAAHRTPVARYVADRLAVTDVSVVVDLGRLRPDDATLALVREVGRLWLLLEPTIEQVTAGVSWRPLLERTCTVELLLADRPATSGPYPAREITRTLGWDCLDTIQHDRRGALALRGIGAPAPWLVQRLPLVRQARQLLQRISPPERQEVGV